MTSGARVFRPGLGVAGSMVSDLGFVILLRGLSANPSGAVEPCMAGGAKRGLGTSAPAADFFIVSAECQYHGLAGLCRLWLSWRKARSKGAHGSLICFVH